VASPKVLGRGCAFFVITIQLTEIGERKLDDIILIVFQVNTYHEYYFHAIKKSLSFKSYLNAVSFQFLKLIRNSVQSLKWFFDELQFLSKQQFENMEIEHVSEAKKLFQEKNGFLF